VTVEEVVNEGLAKFDKGNYKEAEALFDQAEGMGPNKDELAAICYNRACARVKLSNMQGACEDLKRAVNDYSVKYSTVLKDKDLALLRDLPLFDTLSNDLTGASNEDQLIRIKTEAQSPFRLARLFVTGSGSIASAVALTATVPALIGALARDVPEEVSKQGLNLGVNAGVLALCLFLLFRDFKARGKQEETTRRIEILGKLQVKRDDSSRLVALSRLRGVNRPVIVAGTKAHLRKVMKEAQSFRADLKERGLVVVGVVVDDPLESSRSKLDALKKGFGERKDSGGGGEAAPELDGGKSNIAAKTLQLTAVDPDSWKEWVEEQMKESNVPIGQSIYVALGLDGSVVFSGIKGPNWISLCQEFEPLDSTRTKITQK